MPSRFNRYVEITGRAAGRFLSSFSYVLTTLFAYLVICFATLAVVRWSLGANKGAAFITFEVATGGDPYNFKDLASSHPILWVWMLILHLLSWLIVPVLAATAIDAAYRKWEERRILLEVALQQEMSGVLQRHVAISEEEADRLSEQLLLEATKKLAVKRTKQ